MKCSLNGLQRNTVDSFNSLVKMLNESKETRHGDLIVDSYMLTKFMESLRIDVISLAAIIDPETGIDLLSDKEVSVGVYMNEDAKAEWEEERAEEEAYERSVSTP